MASIELTELIQTAAVAGDGAIALGSDDTLKRVDVPAYDESGAAVTPSPTDIVIGEGGKKFTVASLSTTVGGPLGTAAYVDTGTASGEVPLNSNLGTGAYFSPATTTFTPAVTVNSVAVASFAVSVGKIHSITSSLKHIELIVSFTATDTGFLGIASPLTPTGLPVCGCVVIVNNTYTNISCAIEDYGSGVVIFGIRSNGSTGDPISVTSGDDVSVYITGTLLV